jgi:hypothetical protein
MAQPVLDIHTGIWMIIQNAALLGQSQWLSYCGSWSPWGGATTRDLELGGSIWYTDQRKVGGTNSNYG